MFLLSGVLIAQAIPTKSSDCLRRVRLTDEAEMQEGGSRYKPALQKMKRGKPMEGMKHENAGMEEAHMSHKSQYGGEFFMAPNKTHHLEAIYSKECGFTLVMYNAHEKPINVNRFQAFIKYVPEAKDEYEFIRFLIPTKDGSLLKAENTPAIRGPFEIELYVKFPDKDEPGLFNIPVAIAGSPGSDAK